MTHTPPPSLPCIIVEEHVVFTFTALCHATGADAAQLQALVDEGLIAPTPSAPPASRTPDDWQFSGDALARARRALRLARDLDLSLSGAVLVMALLAEIESLRARLDR